jgi:hypothetical protein
MSTHIAARLAMRASYACNASSLLFVNMHCDRCKQDGGLHGGVWSHQCDRADDRVTAATMVAAARAVDARNDVRATIACAGCVACNVRSGAAKRLDVALEVSQYGVRYSSAWALPPLDNTYNTSDTHTIHESVRGTQTASVLQSSALHYDAYSVGAPQHSARRGPRARRSTAAGGAVRLTAWPNAPPGGEGGSAVPSTARCSPGPGRPTANTGLIL